MKSLFVSLGIICFAINSLQAQWYEFNTTPTGAGIDFIQSISETELLIRSVEGNLYKSNNNAQSWSQVPTGNYQVLNIVWSEKADVGYYYSSNGDLYRSDDHANSWQLVNHLSQFNDFQIIDSTAGLLNTGSGFKMTQDGGITFYDLNCNNLGNLENIVFVDREIGFALTKCLLKTIDGGLSFDTISVLGQIESYPTAIFFRNTQEAWLFTEIAYVNHQFYKTNNQGTSWEVISWQGALMPDQVHWFDSLQAVIEYGRTYYCTSDGGVSFDAYRGLDGEKYLAFRNDEIWVVGNGDLIAKSTDFVHWDFKASGFVPLVFEHLQTPNSGLISYTGEDSPYLFLKQPDSGSFKQIAPFGMEQNYQRIADIKLFNQDTIWVSGKDGKVIESTNGGMTWNTLFESPQDGYVAQLEIGTNQCGFAILRTDPVGWNNNQLYRISSNGQQWDYLFSIDYGEIQLVNDQLIVISRLANNQIMFSMDSGENWNSITAPVPTSNTYFINDSTAIVYTSNYNDYITSNAGMDWNVITSLGKKILDIHFFNNDKGIVLCYDGIYQTQNQGQSWDLAYSCTVTNLLPSIISFANDTTGYILGFDEDCEAFLLSTTDGLQWINHSVHIQPLVIYPNPAEDLITIQHLQNSDHPEYWIYSLNGQEISSGKLENSSISVGNLAKGSYFIIVKTNSNLQYSTIFEKL